MDKQVIAIGGGGFGRNPGLGIIEKYILDQSKKCHDLTHAWEEEVGASKLKKF